MIATATWEFKIYQVTLAAQGLKLTPLLHYKQPLESPSICISLKPGKKNTLFYTLRMGIEEGEKTVKAYRLYRKDKVFEEEAISLHDKTTHLLMAKEEGFVAFAKEHIYYYRENKLSEIKVDPKYFGLFSCFFWRQVNEKKDYFALNEQGNLFNLTFDKLGSAALVHI
jgi:hypothetical protein